jgi:molecular chaperone GrpE
MNKEPEEKPVDTAETEPQIQAATEADVEAMDAAATATDAAPTIESLQAELADAEKRVLLGHADLENFRRRNRREMQDQLRYASLGMMTEVLESVDNLQRAIESYEQEPNGDGLVEGVKLVAQQISTVLENNGCKKIVAVGQPFDPNLHQALQMQPSDEFDANTVMMDLRAGFQLHDRVVRPSQVFVSTGPQE